jgi:PAS domain S-box-containing protein
MIRSANPAAEGMFGFTAGELIGRDVKVLLPESAHDGASARCLETRMNQGMGSGREARAQRQDGSTFPVELSIIALACGELFAGIFRNPAERRQAEARAREAGRMESVRMFAAGLGHDMGNVLLPVRAHINALKVELESVASSQKHVERIEQGVQYLHQLADGLHYLSLEPERVEMTEHATVLTAWWRQAGQLLSRAVPKHVRLSASFSRSLPEVALSAHDLTQAVLNLIVNAGQAIPVVDKHEQGTVRVTARTEHEGASVCVSVRDNGVGMDEETRRWAFDMFYTSRPTGRGGGLGLVIVRRIAERCGGTINVTSAPGEGTTVDLILPIAMMRDRDIESVQFAISLSSPRAASAVSAIVKAQGARGIVQSTPNDATVWVVEPQPKCFGDARLWRQAHPRRCLVLFGAPANGRRADWHTLDPIVIEEPDDILSMRQAIRAAIACAT